MSYTDTTHSSKVSSRHINTIYIAPPGSPPSGCNSRATSPRVLSSEGETQKSRSPPLSRGATPSPLKVASRVAEAISVHNKKYNEHISEQENIINTMQNRMINDERMFKSWVLSAKAGMN